MFAMKKLCLENVAGTVADIIAAGLRKTNTVLNIYIVGVFALQCFFVSVPIKFYLIDGIKMPLIPLEFFSSIRCFVFAHVLNLITKILRFLRF